MLRCSFRNTLISVRECGIKPAVVGMISGHLLFAVTDMEWTVCLKGIDTGAWFQIKGPALSEAFVCD